MFRRSKKNCTNKSDQSHDNATQQKANEQESLSKSNRRILMLFYTILFINFSNIPSTPISVGVYNKRKLLKGFQYVWLLITSYLLLKFFLLSLTVKEDCRYKKLAYYLGDSLTYLGPTRKIFYQIGALCNLVVLFIRVSIIRIGISETNRLPGVLDFLLSNQNNDNNICSGKPVNKCCKKASISCEVNSRNDTTVSQSGSFSCRVGGQMEGSNEEDGQLETKTKRDTSLEKRVSCRLRFLSQNREKNSPSRKIMDRQVLANQSPAHRTKDNWVDYSKTLKYSTMLLSTCILSFDITDISSFIIMTPLFIYKLKDKITLFKLNELIDSMLDGKCENPVSFPVIIISLIELIITNIDSTMCIISCWVLGLVMHHDISIWYSRIREKLHRLGSSSKSVYYLCQMNIDKQRSSKHKTPMSSFVNWYHNDYSSNSVKQGAFTRLERSSSLKKSEIAQYLQYDKDKQARATIDFESKTFETNTDNSLDEDRSISDAYHYYTIGERTIIFTQLFNETLLLQKEFIEFLSEIENNDNLMSVINGAGILTFCCSILIIRNEFSSFDKPANIVAIFCLFIAFSLMTIVCTFSAKLNSAVGRSQFMPLIVTLLFSDDNQKHVLASLL